MTLNLEHYARTDGGLQAMQEDIELLQKWQLELASELVAPELDSSCTMVFEFSADCCEPCRSVCIIVHDDERTALVIANEKFAEMSEVYRDLRLDNCTPVNRAAILYTWMGDV